MDMGLVESINDVGWEETHVWRFEISQCVSHSDQSLPSLVRARQRTTKGNELYDIRSFKDVDPLRDRLIRGDCLVDVVVGSAPCEGCILYQTVLCCGR
jgi:hypothetical protein